MANRGDADRPAPDIVEPGVPAISELREDQLLEGAVDEGEMPMPDRPLGAADWGTTAREEGLGESVAMRARREMPDRLPHEDPHLTRPLLEPGDDEYGIDGEADLVGELDAEGHDVLSAEEAALRIEDEPAGLNYDPDPGYVDP